MQTGAKVNQLLNLGAAHAYYFHLGTWYHKFKSFPAVLIDKNGYIRFETEAYFNQTPGIHVGTTVTVHAGIASLPGYVPFSSDELELLAQATTSLAEQIGVPVNEKTLRKKREIDALIRKQKLVQEIKNLYKHKCQICGERLQVRPGKYYSEVHHIKPLGQQHDGPDVKANMICVCPNHHTLLDFFALRLDVNMLIHNQHQISEEYIAYHNQRFEQLN